MRKYESCPGRMNEVEHPAPDRTAYKSIGTFGETVIFQVWSNRQAMARSIRMQERRERHSDDWKALVRLSDGEGY